ncbi:MAG: Carbon monoxide oxidation accessory protein CoxG, partial [uncultured Rubrobacteraceae bacterium]
EDPERDRGGRAARRTLRGPRRRGARGAAVAGSKPGGEERRRLLRGNSQGKGRSDHRLLPRHLTFSRARPRRPPGSDVRLCGREGGPGQPGGEDHRLRLRLGLPEPPEPGHRLGRARKGRAVRPRCPGQRLPTHPPTVRPQSRVRGSIRGREERKGTIGGVHSDRRDGERDRHCRGRRSETNLPDQTGCRGRRRVPRHAVGRRYAGTAPGRARDRRARVGTLDRQLRLLPEDVACLPGGHEADELRAASWASRWQVVAKAREL